MSYRAALAFLGPAAIATWALTAPAVGQSRQVVTGPVATYWLTADTVTGYGAMGAGMSIGRLMGGGGGGGGGGGTGGAQRMMQLYLGSKTRPSAGPDANHLPPTGLKMGPSLPLLSPQKAEPVPESGMMRRDYPDEPAGRLKVYWGCGEKVRPGQPIVIDYSKPGARSADALAGATLKGLEPPTAGKYASFGEWPNRKSNKNPSLSATLVGEHVVKSNYAPEIRFSLVASQDFLAPLLPKRATLPSGSGMLRWASIANAKAYFAGVMSSNDNRDTIVWSSSELRTMAMGMPPYLGQSEITRLVGQRVLMGAQQTECAIPAEVVKAARESGMLFMTAFGQEADFSYPPRPTSPTQPWNIQWSAKALTKATYMGMLGDDRGSASDVDEGQTDDAVPPEARKKKSILESLGRGLF